MFGWVGTDGLFVWIGLLFTHWIADSLTLWKSPETQSDARLWTAASYYSILSRVSPVLLYVYSSVAVVGGATLLWSLGDLRAGNLMFDGGSVCEFLCPLVWTPDAHWSAVLYSSAVIMYFYSVIPSECRIYTALSAQRLQLGRSLNFIIPPVTTTVIAH